MPKGWSPRKCQGPFEPSLTSPCVSITNPSAEKVYLHSDLPRTFAVWLQHRVGRDKSKYMLWRRMAAARQVSASVKDGSGKSSTCCSSGEEQRNQDLLKLRTGAAFQHRKGSSGEQRIIARGKKGKPAVYQALPYSSYYKGKV